LNRDNKTANINVKKL